MKITLYNVILNENNFILNESLFNYLYFILKNIKY